VVYNRNVYLPQVIVSDKINHALSCISLEESLYYSLHSHTASKAFRMSHRTFKVRYASACSKHPSLERLNHLCDPTFVTRKVDGCERGRIGR
jgi:hypothetical protein